VSDMIGISAASRVAIRSVTSDHWRTGADMSTTCRYSENDPISDITVPGQSPYFEPGVGSVISELASSGGSVK
jgi:hypothetical protein